MQRIACAAWVLAVTMIGETAVAQNGAQAIAECDRLAASDLDRSRPGNVPGVAFPLINAEAAVPACEGAVKADPKNARLYFQLGRSFTAARQYDNALKALTIAVELGSLPAAVELGRAYRLGRNVPKDSARARSLFEKAAAAGLPQAMFFLGHYYRKGDGVPRDRKIAAQWYQQARAALQTDLELGSTTAMFMVGRMHEKGWGGPKNSSEARAWYAKAAERGHRGARSRLKRLGKPWEPPQ